MACNAAKHQAEVVHLSVRLVICTCLEHVQSDEHRYVLMISASAVRRFIQLRSLWNTAGYQQGSTSNATEFGNRPLNRSRRPPCRSKQVN
mmetsp:Transcript_65837/g.165944  ORF Transcript_65837/g.165944 Transcript_65837/m.165944 type:complete len:90 (+) Transcript_65837:246-515(+)